MRLLKRSPSGSISLTSFDDENVPRYAILSHTWTDGQEVTYPEFVAGDGIEKTGYDKIRFCVDQAARDGIEYSWVDTCCIDKSTSDELQTAINSMFRWYQHATKCYVYLSDVKVPPEVDDVHKFRITWDDAFRKSRWFTRGWTLQELLAPPAVEFFSKEERRLGSKISLEQEICQITQIPVEALRQSNLSIFSIDERMRWALRRTTTKREDKAYCLVGLLGVFLPLIYGEGEDYALQRLRDEVARRQQGFGTKHLQETAVPSSLPFPRNLSFAGREDQLSTIEQSLLHTDGHQRMSMCGLGGCGKSAIALELAYRSLAADARRLVFWVPAISQQSFDLAYREIGVRLHVPGIDDDNADTKKLVCDMLGSNNMQDWLMIVDNADDLDVLLNRVDLGSESLRLYDYLPYSSNGKILFTTRSMKAAESLTPTSILKLQDPSEIEAKQILAGRITKQSSLSDNKAVTELLELLEFLPLAIVQACGFINNNDVSISDYVSMLRETETRAELFSELYEDHRRYPGMDGTIAKTWYISFNQIQRHDPLAAEYLSFMACIDRINIPQSLLPDTDSQTRRFKAIGTLKAYAFITERQQTLSQTGSERFFDMHRLVHMALARWLDEQDEWTTWMTKAAARLEDLIILNDELRKREVWTSYLPHAMHVTDQKVGLDELTRASLLEEIGSCQERLGQYAAALATQRQTIALKRAVLGDEHHRTLKSMVRLASVLDRQGRYGEAVAMIRQVNAQFKTVLGPRHPDTMKSTSDLALYLEREGKYEESEAIGRVALDLSITVLGIEHHDTLSTMDNLAQVLGRQGKYEEAEPISRKILAQRKIELGPDHPETLITMNNLALILEKRGKLEEAEAINRETLALKQVVLGPDHPETLITMSNLTLLVESQGQYKEAEAMNREILAKRKTVLGPDHPETLITMSNLGLMLNERGKFEEGKAMVKETLAIRDRVLGPYHPSTLLSVHSLALILETERNYEEAEALMRQTLARSEELFGLEHHDTLDRVQHHARLLARLERYEESDALYQRASTGLKSVLGEDHRKTRECSEDFTRSLRRRGQSPPPNDRKPAGQALDIPQASYPTTPPGGKRSKREKWRDLKMDLKKFLVS